ncbi:MAG TPA: PEP-CTERM sorting domain-containing protein [Aquabacterium sp.]|uniref:PEP-CTERM sorting domain-containing protein n=1 Tax=Aquabacterium sp. TaxID=1872578 RepID=UPI002E376045|nr:PEP-CTERM sorting domain-containing protein [Aquabacterium sp.]HEX5357012.1 PEP-CTERM sorting domain-containing protein [Aquabacterium sp.]
MVMSVAFRPAVRSALMVALVCAWPLAHAADGSSVVSTPEGSYEELRFYTPASSIPTAVGTAQGSSNLCTSGANAGQVCAETLGFQSITAGLVTSYGYSETVATPVVYQNLTPTFAGLGVAALNGASISGDTSVDQAEGISLLFANPVEVLGFTFFDLNHQAFAPGSAPTLQLIVDERNYTINAADTSLLSSIKGKEFTLLGGATSYYLGAVRIAAVPEASTLALMGLGLAGIVLAGRRQRRG